jgi:dihydrofolate synthase/folylpolyglutamate synthase
LAFETVAAIARDRSSPVLDAGDHARFDRDPTADGTQRESADERDPGAPRLHLRTARGDYGRLVLGLRGRHQIDNAEVAVTLLEALDARGVLVPKRAVVEGLERANWPGRLDIRRLHGREALLDAAHNPDGAAALAAYLTTSPFAKAPLIFGAMRDKDIDGIVRALAPVVGAVVITHASHPRAAEPDELAARVRNLTPGLPVTIARSPSEALDEAWRRSPRIVVAGSIFLLGDVMKVAGWS